MVALKNQPSGACDASPLEKWLAGDTPTDAGLDIFFEDIKGDPGSKMRKRFEALLSNGPPSGYTVADTTRALIERGLPLSAFEFNNADISSNEFGDVYVIDIPATSSVLMDAATSNNCEIIVELVRAGADPLERLSYDTETPGFHSPFIASANEGKMSVVAAMFDGAASVQKTRMANEFLGQIGEPESTRRLNLVAENSNIVDVISYVSAIKAESVVESHINLSAAERPEQSAHRPF